MAEGLCHRSMLLDPDRPLLPVCVSGAGEGHGLDRVAPAGDEGAAVCAARPMGSSSWERLARLGLRPPETPAGRAHPRGGYNGYGGITGEGPGQATLPGPRGAILKITFVLKHANLSGGVRVVAIHAAGLARRGHDVLVVSTPLPRPRLRSVLRSLVRERRLPRLSRKIPSHLDDLEGSGVRHRLLDRDRPVTDADVPDADVVISTWWETAEWVARLAPSKGAKCSLLQGFEIQDPTTRERAEATWRLPFHRIAVSRWLANLALKRFGDAQVSLAPNGVDTRQFFAPPRSRGEPPRVGLVYSANPVKQTWVALEAMRRMRETLPQVRLLCFGPEAPARGALPPDAAFHLRPPQGALRRLYSHCDAWLCSSESEGFGLPLLEAMACRTPVVSTRSGGPEDFVEDGVNGYLVDVGNVPGIADRIHTLLACEPSQWEAMSRAAHATAVRCTWDEATDLFEQALYLATERAARSEIAGARA